MKAERGVFTGFVAALVGVAVAGFAQVVENPAKPKTANAGRVVVPEEVLAISDEGTGEYYFKWPRGLRTAADGSLFLTDEDQVLTFDTNGKFLRNLFKKGQGPGEMPYAGACLATDKAIVVYSGYPSKLVFFGPSGRYEREVPVRPEGRTSLTLIGHRAGRLYFESGEFPRTTGDPDVIDNPRTIVAVSVSDGSITPLAAFVTRAWVVSSPGGGGGMFSITSLIAVPFGRDLLALAHTEDYLVKIYDPAANRVLKEFRRPYERVKPEPLTEEQKKGGIIINGKHYGPPERKYQTDVLNLLTRGDEIWAVTSTKDKAKGALVDVFDGEGVYQDCFWLNLAEAALKGLLSPGQSVLDGKFLWAVERSEDETYAIKKYRVGK